MKIWEPRTQKIQPVLRLLQDFHDEDIDIVATNEDGAEMFNGNLLGITEDRFLYVQQAVNSDLDFNFDILGRIKINYSYDRTPVSQSGLYKEPIFRLVEYDDTITLALVDENGDRISRGSILGFKNKQIILYSHVNPNYGLKLDEHGIIITK